MMHKLSKRLQTALDWVTGTTLLDVGTDHALLCVGAILQGVVQKAIASDNKEGPFLKAKETVFQANLEQSIECRLADGLQGLQEPIDTCTILGMGGLLIKELLQVNEVHYVKQFILGPQSEHKELRAFLMNHGFMIVDETTIEERKKYYVLMKVVFGPMEYSPLEIEYGRININKQEHAWQQMIQKRIDLLEHALSKANDLEKRKQIQAKVTELRSVLHERN